MILFTSTRRFAPRRTKRFIGPGYAGNEIDFGGDGTAKHGSGHQLLNLPEGKVLVTRNWA